MILNGQRWKKLQKYWYKIDVIFKYGSYIGTMLSFENKISIDINLS